jgi:hypothetical protein
MRALSCKLIGEPNDGKVRAFLETESPLNNILSKMSSVHTLTLSTFKRNLISSYLNLVFQIMVLLGNDVLRSSQ